jgi:hypothetical protein
VERFLSRALISLAAAVAAIMLVATAVVFLCGALYLCLVSMSAAPPLAALIVGLVLLILAGLIILAARVTPLRGGTSRTSGKTGIADPGPTGDVGDLAATLGGLAAQQLSGHAQAHPYRTFAVALLAGLAVGASPELRNMLKTALKT